MIDLFDIIISFELSVLSFSLRLYDITLLKNCSTMHIPAHLKHRVEWTDPHEKTFWLAVFYN
jgi:hypothetical protein